jgi:hypothetical protein
VTCVGKERCAVSQISVYAFNDYENRVQRDSDGESHAERTGRVGMSMVMSMRVATLVTMIHNEISLFEANLTGFPSLGLDRQRNRRVGGNRRFCFALQAVLTGWR